MVYPSFVVSAISTYRKLRHSCYKKKLLRNLSEKSVIIVSGCQRSGTTSVSKMIAYDIGYTFIDEHEYGVHDYERFKQSTKKNASIVVHCPALSHKILSIVKDVPKSHIMWVKRPHDEIRKSMDRIGWAQKEEAREKLKYLKLIDCKNLTIEETKTIYWNNTQSVQLDESRFTEIDFHGPYVGWHPLFISPKYRKNFSPKRTSL